jgi:hypothetical protein
MKQADDVFNSRDLDAMDALHHPEVVAYTTGAAEPTRILRPHRELIEDLIRAFPDVRVHNDPYPIQFGQGEWTTAISKMTGTFTGELIGPDGQPIPPTGKPFDVKFTTIGKVAGGPARRGVGLLGPDAAARADRARGLRREEGE